MGILDGELPAERLEERIIEIEIERLRDFRNHPFQIKEDQEMKDLMDSIRLYGILTPLIVRPLPDGVYKISYAITVKAS